MKHPANTTIILHKSLGKGRLQKRTLDLLTFFKSGGERLKNRKPFGEFCHHVQTVQSQDCKAILKDSICHYHLPPENDSNEKYTDWSLDKP